MNTNQPNAGLPAALLVNTVTTNNTLNIRNNIFANTQTAGGTQHYIVFTLFPPQQDMLTSIINRLLHHGAKPRVYRRQQPGKPGRMANGYR